MKQQEKVKYIKIVFMDKSMSYFPVVSYCYIMWIQLNLYEKVCRCFDEKWKSSTSF